MYSCGEAFEDTDGRVVENSNEDDNLGWAVRLEVSENSTEHDQLFRPLVAKNECNHYSPFAWPEYQHFVEQKPRIFMSLRFHSIRHIIFQLTWQKHDYNLVHSQAKLSCQGAMNRKKCSRWTISFGDRNYGKPHTHKKGIPYSSRDRCQK